MDKDKQLEQLKLRLEDSVEAIDVHQEAQELIKLFAHSEVFTVQINPQPCFQDFTDSVRSARWRNVRVLHLTGHGESKCGFFWLKHPLKNPAVSTTEYDNEISIDRFANILSSEVGGGQGKGTIECVVLNACETEPMGKKLRSVAASCCVLAVRGAGRDGEKICARFLRQLERSGASQGLQVGVPASRCAHV